MFYFAASFHVIWHVSSGLLGSPPRSCDRLDDDHMTAILHRRWGELVPLVVVHGRLSYFNVDGFSSCVVCGVCAHSVIS